MKKLILSIAVFTLAIAAHATVITVSNNPNSPGQYSDLQVAVDSASANDTLYVHGSGISYGSVNINKPISIFGAGALPNKIKSLETVIGNIHYGYSSNFQSNASGSRLYGCKVTSTVTFRGHNGNGVGDIILSRNNIDRLQFPQSSHIFNNYIIAFNVIGELGYSASLNIKINNMVINNNIIEKIMRLGYQGSGSWLLNNNVITGSFNHNTAGTITNNIFYVADSLNMNNNTYTNFNNNIFFAYSSGSFNSTNFNSGTNSGSGNIVNQDPNFVYYVPTATKVFNYTYTSPSAGPFVNFRLSATSPGINYGTDSTDVGIYGGPTPFVEGSPANSRFRYFPMPKLPQVLDVTINNSSLPQNGNLNVRLKARKQE